MAWFVVSDVVNRLLGKLGQWHDDEDHIIHYLGHGGIEKLNQLEETLKTLLPRLRNAERQIWSKIMRKEEAVDVPLKEWVKRVKGVLYEMEELFEEVDIAEREIQQQVPAKLSSCLYKLMIPLCSNLASKQEGTMQRCLLQVQKKLTQQFESLMGKWEKIQDYIPKQEEVGEDAEPEDLLTPQLIQCFAYCSLFPKPYDIKKTELVNHWMAQGFLDMSTPLNGVHQTPQQVAHQYSKVLQDGDPIMKYSKDVTKRLVLNFNLDTEAKKVGRGECLLLDHERDDLTDIDNCVHDLLHVSFIVGSSREAPQWLLHAKQLRSLLLHTRGDSDADSVTTFKNLDKLLSSLTCLRALDLGRVNLQNLPDSIAALKHLRYLKLGGPLQTLPQSIMRLPYLQTLDLQACPLLIKIPKFDHNVTLLFSEKHHQFTVDNSNSLDALVNSDKPASGKFEIFFKRRRRRAVSEASAANLESKLVNDLVLEWSSLYPVPDAHADMNKEESVLRRMKPPQSLTHLTVRFWKGTRFPSWGTTTYLNLPSLVSVEIEGCNRCKYLPSLSRLPHLQYLRLANLEVLEYVEEIGVADGNIDNDAANSASCFRSLENLILEELPQLKGWSSDIQQRVFPRLSQLRIHLCPELISMPHAPSLQSLSVEGIHRKLLKHLHDTHESPTTSPAPSRKEDLQVQIASVAKLDSLSIYPLNSYSFDLSFKIKKCNELVNLTVAPTYMSGTQVEAYSCGRLRHISGEVQHIKELIIWRCEGLELWNMMESNDGGDRIHMERSTSSSSTATGVRSAAWQDLTGLRRLTLGSITKLESLPRGLACLNRLKELKIFQLRNLRALPEWIGDLDWLELVEIVDCTKMRTLFLSSSGGSGFRSLAGLTIRIERCQGMVENLFGDENYFFLKRLEIHRCDRLKDLSPKTVSIKQLVLLGDCRELRLWQDDVIGYAALKELVIEDCSNLRMLFDSSPGSVGLASWQRLTRLTSLTLNRISKLECLPEGLACLKNLRKLKISKLPDLRQLPDCIHHLSLLYSFEIDECPNLTAFPDSLGALTSLRYLTIDKCPNLTALPNSLGALTSLEHLTIDKCPNLTALPASLGALTSLEYLTIDECPNLTALPNSLPNLRFLSIEACNPELKSRCQITTGEDWPKIKHIGNIWLDGNCLKMDHRFG